MNLSLAVQVLRINHWYKNIFVLAGWVLAHYYRPHYVTNREVLLVLGAIFLACLVSSVNYIINEITDAPFDRQHPYKRHRPVASRQIQGHSLIIPAMLILAVSLFLAWLLYPVQFFLSLTSLAVSGLIYNVPPVRSKDIPILDVISEAINFPLRIIIGWSVCAHTWYFPPVILLFVFWSLGLMLMTGKRLAEVRELGNLGSIYRPTFHIYNNKRLTYLIIFYATVFMAFFCLLTKSVSEFRLFIPFMAIFVIWFLLIPFARKSIMVEPEKIYRHKAFFFYSITLAISMGFALFLSS